MTAGERLVELSGDPDQVARVDLPGAVRAGLRRRRRRGGALAALVAVLLAALVVRHVGATPTAPTTPVARAVSTSGVSADEAPGVRSDQRAVVAALSHVAPTAPSLAWRTHVQVRREEVGGLPTKLLDVERWADVVGTGEVPGSDTDGEPLDGVGYRVSHPLPRRDGVDPCTVAGVYPEAARATPAQQVCTRDSGASGGPGGDAHVAGAGGVVALRSWSRFVTAMTETGLSPSGAVQTVREAVLVAGDTTWSLAVTATTSTGPQDAAAVVPALDLAQLELGVRYLAASAAAGGPGVATGQLLSRAAVDGALAGAGPQVPPVGWHTPSATTAANAGPGPRGHELLDLLESAPLGPATLGYRVVVAPGGMPSDLCHLDATVVTVAGGSEACVVTGTSPAGTQEVVQEGTAGVLRARQVTEAVGAGPGLVRWASVAETAPGAAATGPALPLAVEQLRGVAQALLAADPP